MVINLNDDRMIMEFLSGRYLGVPDGHVVYMNYPVTGILAALYQIAPRVEWYHFFLLGAMSCCLILTVYRIFSMTSEKERKWIYTVLAAGLCSFAMGREFFCITYTTVAAIVGATTVFWYGTSKGSKADIIIIAVLSSMTWCIRDELFLLIVPASGLIWLLKELPKNKSIWKKITIPAAVLCVILICSVINHVMYTGEDWENYDEFNGLRTEIFDYQDSYYFPNYDAYKEYYERMDLTNEERRMLIYYNFTLVNDEIDEKEISELFAQMIEYRDDYGIDEGMLPIRQRIPIEIKAFIKNSSTGAYGSLYNVGLLGYLLLIGWCFLKKNWKSLIEAAAFLGAGTGLFVFMEIRGRMPERVVYSLSLVLFVTMILNYVWNYKKISESKIMKRIVFSVIAVCAVMGIFSCCMTIKENIVKIKSQQELEDIQNYCYANEDNFYIVTGDVLVGYGSVINLDTINNKELNYISTGDWISYSPIESKKLAKEGIGSVAKALLYDEDVYLISVKDSANLNYITNYLTFRNKKEVAAIKVEDLSEKYAVYTFE